MSAHRFNYLLSQLYKAGDSDGECVAVGCVLFSWCRNTLLRLVGTVAGANPPPTFHAHRR